MIKVLGDWYERCGFSIVDKKKIWTFFFNTENHTAYVKVIIYQWIFNQHNMVCCEICQEPGMNVLYESNECEKNFYFFPLLSASVCVAVCVESNRRSFSVSYVVGHQIIPRLLL